MAKKESENRDLALVGEAGSAWDEQLLDDVRTTMEEVLRGVFHNKREVFLAEVLRSLRSARARPSAGKEPESSDGEWIPVESLSSLRSLVGGRFQNIKRKWIDAGLPLREHRGDRSGDYDINSEGWVELEAWINKQGFEARREPDGERGIFSLRPLPKRKKT